MLLLNAIIYAVTALMCGSLQAQLLRPTGPVVTDFADPSAPDLSEPGYLRLYTTAGEVLTWRYGAGTSPADAMRAKAPKHERLSICHSDGTRLNSEAGEDVWDPTIRDGILYAGAMTPPKDREFALWPDDNWSRRTYAFLNNGRCWVMQREPLWGRRPRKMNWIGHNYGHEFLRGDDGALYVFYERVTDDSYDSPWKTELFARKMLSPLRASDIEIPIYQIPDQPWPATKRASGGALIEGARPLKAVGKYFISFSAGEYTAKSYGIYLLWSNNIEGPYTPFLNGRKTDLKNFGRAIEAEIPMTWGAARATLFESKDQWWAVFHGIAESENQNLENGKRSVYLSPVSIELSPNGEPVVQIQAPLPNRTPKRVAE